MPGPASLTVHGKRRSLPAALPYGVVIDTAVCRDAPRVLTLSGFASRPWFLWTPVTTGKRSFPIPPLRAAVCPTECNLARHVALSGHIGRGIRQTENRRSCSWAPP